MTFISTIVTSVVRHHFLLVFSDPNSGATILKISRTPETPEIFASSRDEVEVALDHIPVGRYVLVKFLKPRSDASERIGVVGIKFGGFNRKAIFAAQWAIESIPPEKVNRMLLYFRFAT